MVMPRGASDEALSVSGRLEIDKIGRHLEAKLWAGNEPDRDALLGDTAEPRRSELRCRQPATGSIHAGRCIVLLSVCACLSLAVEPIRAEEVRVRPVAAAFSSSPAYPYPAEPQRYGIERAFDGDPDTFCCLLDDSLDGADEQTIPARGAAPVTGYVVFDLGAAVPVAGVRIVARRDGGPYNPSRVDFCWFPDGLPDPQVAASRKGMDEQGKTLIAAQAIPALTNGRSFDVRWPVVRTRFLAMRVHDSFESGPKHFNFQIGEIEFSADVREDDEWDKLRFCGERPRWQPLLEQTLCLQRAMEHLGQQFPGEYQAAALLRDLGIIQEKIRGHQQTESPPWASAPPDYAAITSELEELKYEALVRRNPWLDPGKILFVKRHTYQTGWYYSEFMQAGRFGGNLCVLSLEDGSVNDLLPELSAGIFDRYDLSFDANRVAFGYRPAPGRAFRLRELERETGKVRELTTDPPGEAARLASYGLIPGQNELGPWRQHTDDFHPCYLPDGSICFASSRCERGVLCDQGDRLSVNVLYRMDADGTNLRLLSQGALSESTPVVMNDGRILYTRWEYVDKGVIAVQSLWSMRPDGGGSCEVFGNHHEFPPVLIHGRPLPGVNDRFVCTATMHHPFAVGPIVTVDTSQDIRTQAPLRNLTPDTWLSVDGVGGFPRGENYIHWKDGRWVKDNRGPLFCDPYPLGDDFFLVTCNPDQPWNHESAYGIWLIDTFGNRVPIYDAPAISCWQPMPLRPRAAPPILPDHSDAAVDVIPIQADEAVVLLNDVYQGLEGVSRGEVKYLRILEQVPRPWTAHRFWPGDETLGQNAVISLNAHIFVKILHGVVPVEADGSAHFVVPADKNLFFQVLDADLMEIQRMRTFVNLPPGSTRSCIGCHEPRNQAPPARLSIAAARPPHHPGPQAGDRVPRALDYAGDVQPILDRRCVSCHDAQPDSAKPDLRGELTTYFNRSYESLMNGGWVTCIQEFQGPQPRAQKTNVTPLPPKALGSHASRLITILRDGHYQVELPRDEWVLLTTWVDANAPYYGTYFGRRNLMYRGLPDFRPAPTLTAPDLPSSP